MKEFTPSKDFVTRVMHDVDEFTCSREEEKLAGQLSFLDSPLVKFGLSCSGFFLGCWNLIRIYLAFFSPIICH